MKTNPTDPFDFNQSSPSGQAGFEVFENEKKQSWYFHGNDVGGTAILFSQSYSSSDAAHRGLNTSLKLLKKKRAKLQESPEGWQIVVRSGNHQELMRSLPFPTEAEAQKRLEFFLKVAASSNPVAKAQVAPPSPETSTVIAPTNSENPVRHAFRLYFYPADKDGALSGRLENINNPTEKTSFKGLDGQAILQFLQKSLNLAPEAPAKQTAEQAQFSTVSAVISAGSSSIVDRSLQGTVLKLTIAPETGMPPATNQPQIESCQLAIRHMDSQEVSTWYNVPAQHHNNGQIKMELETSSLPFGTYYLNAAVWLQQASNVRLCVQGTGWIQLF